MKRLMLALITFPFVAGAQIDSSPPEFHPKMIVEGAGGVAIRPSDATAQSLAGTYTFALGRTWSPRTSWRVGLELETWNSASSSDDIPFWVLGASFGFLAAQTAHDRGFYITGRVGLYMHAEAMGASPGGYVGVGGSVPIGLGALTLETGVQGYVIRQPGPDDLSPSSPSSSAPVGDRGNWSVPVRVGFRWLL